ncbi:MULTISPECIES: ABC transporter substrate-binding protein [Cryobacterium]|uniref:Sugar ABC transporter substrate-binding protein n=1 Tax=Cryobacterium glucosi TaxID=1259175 RepID=A0ABY2INB5_9MICO|nr:MULTISPECIES: sugar ABC transporter substrate-binding protein [Cryobacterium]TFC07145.1 sugar ABC transporter substrate-binding protein [Cryobacterium sp. MDB2-33-2]TFC18711.1 sugar ABC transporter substrate-binding protein [Cryobacterium glucosi]
MCLTTKSISLPTQLHHSTKRKHMKSRNRKLIALGLGTALLAGALSGCSGGSSSSGVTTINWWTRVGDDRAAFAKKFNDTHTDVQVKVTQVSDDQYVNKVGTGVRSNNGPDVLDFDVANSPLFAATGVLADVSDKVNGLDFARDLNPGMSKLGTYDNKTYSVPFIAGPSILLYNKTLFKKAGIQTDTPPATWAGIEEDAKKVRALGDDIYGFDIPGACGGCLSFAAQPLIWASGGTTMTAASPDQTTTYSTSPQVADSLKFYQKLWQDGVVNPAGQTEAGATWGADWNAGKVGILLAGSWLVSPAEKGGSEVGYGPIPNADGSNFSTFAGGDNIGVIASSKNPDAAWEFASWLLDKDQQASIADTGSSPVRSDLLTADFAAKYPLVALQLQVSAKSDAPDSMATNALQLSATSPWLAAFQSIVYNGADVNATLTKADADSAPLIKQAYEQAGQ